MNRIATKKNNAIFQLDQPELGVPIEIFKGSFVEQLRPAYEIFIYRVAKEFRLATSFETPIDKPDTNSSITDDGVIVIDMFSYFFETDEEMLKDISDLVDFQAKLADVRSCLVFYFLFLVYLHDITDFNNGWPTKLEHDKNV